METEVLSRVDDQLRQYHNDHQGQTPLYIIVARDEAEQLLKEVKIKENHPQDALVTHYNGLTIVMNDNLKPGEIRLSNELPDTSS